MNPWVLLGVAVMWGLSLFAVGRWQREDGRTAERVAWQGKANEELVQANASILSLTGARLADERRHVDEMAAVSAQLAKERATHEAQRTRDAAAIRDGTLRLRIATASICPGGNQAGTPGTPTPGGDGPATVSLPDALARDLLDLANDADQVADALRACQSIVLNDRKESP